MIGICFIKFLVIQQIGNRSFYALWVRHNCYLWISNTLKSKINEMKQSLTPNELYASSDYLQFPLMKCLPYFLIFPKKQYKV